ncbi:MAG: hypothetical protein ACFFBD_01205 [Candidatus Hodarchaeota archaeon]
MSLFEISLVMNGMPLLTKKFQDQNISNCDSFYRYGIMSVIQAVANQALDDEIELIEFKRIHMASQSKKLQNGDMLHAFAIYGNKNMSEQVRITLQKVLDRFLQKNPVPRRSLSSSQRYLSFLDEIEEIVLGLPEGRFWKKIFSKPFQMSYPGLSDVDDSLKS